MVLARASTTHLHSLVILIACTPPGLPQVPRFLFKRLSRVSLPFMRFISLRRKFAARSTPLCPLSCRLGLFVLFSRVFCFYSVRQKEKDNPEPILNSAKRPLSANTGTIRSYGLRNDERFGPLRPVRDRPSNEPCSLVRPPLPRAQVKASLVLRLM